MIPLVPHLERGRASSYTVEPTLPAGLSIDAASGVIGGTPTVVAAARTYVVRAANPYGHAEATIDLLVNNTSPIGLAYASDHPVYVVGAPVTPNLPSNGGGAIGRYEVTPPLPVGLSLDATTGVVSGTPSVITAAASYTVVGSNTFGQASTSLVITVVDAPPSSLAYPVNPATYSRGVAITPNAPTHAGGTVVTWTVTPALPAGLALDAATGILSGTPTGLTPATDYTVTASNSGGATPVTLRVAVAGPPMITATAAMSVARIGHSATLLPGGAVLVAGGRNDSGYLASAEVYSPGSGTFSTTVAGKTLAMLAPRAGHTATALQNGKVLIAGGQNGTTPLATAELYDPATGTFTSTGPMANGRKGHAALLLPSGKVLVLGGTTSKTAELYDPGSGTFATEGTMTVGRLTPAAVLLSTGKVLVAGGGATRAELYDPAAHSFTPGASTAWDVAGETTTGLALTGGKAIFVQDSTAQSYDGSGFRSLGGSLSSHCAALWEGDKVAIEGQSWVDNGDWNCSSAWSDLALNVFEAASGAGMAVQGHGGRNGGTATTLADQRVLFIGGERRVTQTLAYPACTEYGVPLTTADLLAR